MKISLFKEILFLILRRGIKLVLKLILEWVLFYFYIKELFYFIRKIVGIILFIFFF